MIPSIATVAVIVCVFIVEHLFSFIVKKSNKLLNIYSIVWFLVYAGMFSI